MGQDSLKQRQGEFDGNTNCDTTAKFWNGFTQQLCGNQAAIIMIIVFGCMTMK